MLGLEGKQLAWEFQFWLQGLEVGGHHVLGPDVAIGNLTAPGRQGGSIFCRAVLLVQKNRQFIPAS